MAVSKVEFGGGTLIDLTADTVTAETLMSGYTAHGANGEKVEGTLEVQNYYTGASEPSASLGANGDLYLVVG